MDPKTLRLLMGSAATSAAVAGWDLDNAVFNGTPNQKTIIPGENIYDIAFKSDGTKMYFAEPASPGSFTITVNEYDLSTAWDVTSRSFLQSKTVTGGNYDNIAYSIFFKSDGTRFWVAVYGVDFSLSPVANYIHQYDLSTAWDISTATLDATLTFSASNIVYGITFKSDGTAFYRLESNNIIYTTDLTVAWDIGGGTSTGNTFSVSAQDTAARDIDFNSSGTKLFMYGIFGDDVNEYALSTAWDVSTASFSQSFLPNFNNANGLAFKSDGSRLYLCLGDEIIQLDLSTAYDVSTATALTSPSTHYYSVSSQESSPRGIAFKTDGTKMYIIGSSGDDVNEYDLSTAWAVETSSFVQTFSVSAQETSPSAIAFKTDGTKMYIVGTSGDDVNQYNLSTAWDVSTASFIQTFSVSSQETSPNGIAFKPDGTKMYIVGTSGDDVNEYNLSTAWDVSTASFVQVFSISAQTGSPLGVAFKDDGTKMFIADGSGEFCLEYDLSTAWDVSTASYSKNFDLNRYGTTTDDLAFDTNGTKLLIVDSIADAVWSFDL